ncbi:MAG TPA: ABC transporter permease [Puia sp.]|nr:ABC transporter permease [Puia sp.]
MLRNYFRIAWRSFLKDRQFSLLNILGLSSGICCALLIWLWVADELSVDKFFANDSQIYEVMEMNRTNGQAQITDESSGLVSDYIAGQIPEVEYAASLAPPNWWPKYTLSVGDKNLKATGQYAGKDYFNIFSFPMLEGDKGKVLKDENMIVISDELAMRLFGRTDNLIGQPIRFQQQEIFFVSGVFRKPPRNSSQQFDFVLSFDYLYRRQNWVKSWNNTGPHNFILVRPATDINALNKKIASLITRASGDTSRRPFATRFSNLYLENTFSHGASTGSKIVYVKLFSLIAIFIIIIACINFMNLSTAKASRRMKEVGIKKVVGARRPQLILQFLTESFLITLLATGIALALCVVFLPAFNNLTGKEIVLRPDIRLMEVLFGIVVVTSIVAGSYPAMYLSKFNPLAILKGKLPSSIGELVSRKGLVTFQYSLSAILIVSVLVIYRQVRFIQSTDPGYSKENIVKFRVEGRVQQQPTSFVAAIKRVPGVVNAAFTTHNMVGRNYGTYGINWEGRDPNKGIYFEGFLCSYDFIETMGMHMAAGRSFSRAYGSDTSKVILNETAVAVMHLKNPIGKNIEANGTRVQIIGVVKDFHFESLHEPVKPAFFLLMGDGISWANIMIRIKPGQQQETIAGIRDLWNAFNPGFPFTYDFLDEEYQKQYDTEVRVATLAKWFSGLAILISCLGLFGLAAFTAQRRQKEIGIRKVVGASVSQIAVMLSTDFLLLVSIAIVIAFPVSWWAMREWLQDFAYRVDIGAGVFVLAAVAVILITLLTIGSHALRAAVANPVKTLRSE